MNRIFNVIWSTTKEKWLVVSEKVKSNGGVPKSSLLSIAVLTSLFAAGVPAYAIDSGALPTGGQITAGAGTIGASGTSMTVNQSSQQMIANWSSFNIGKDASVQFIQPNVSATVLNHIADQNPTQILGSLSANGKVFLLNQSGIIFGKNARVDVGALVASSLDLRDSDFLAGRYKFNNSGTAGEILNQGSINIFQDGVVALIGTKVTNEGAISANGGSVALGAGNQVSLDLKGDGLITFTVDEGAVDALVENKGLIKGDGGLVVMTARAADVLTQSAVNNSGIVQARSMEQKEGRILLDAVGGMTTVSGTLDASSTDGKGGQVVATGDRVLVKDGAHLTASGLTGGGEVLVGGNWQGKDTSIHQATGTIVESGALLEANATDTGNGGTVVAWSDVTNPLSVTRAYGTFEAMGGTNGGDGGRIETSGHWLDVAGISVSASSPTGTAGLWLLDPYNVTISSNIINNNGSWDTTSSDPFWIPNGTSSNIWVHDIENQLNSGTNVTVQTLGIGTGNQEGIISIDTNINITSISNVKLTLNAYDHINLTSDIIDSGSDTNSKLDLDFITVIGGVTGLGNITGNNGATTFNIGGSSDYAGSISGANRSVIKNGIGSLKLSGISSYTGSTTVSSGTLLLGASNIISDQSNVTVNTNSILNIGIYSDIVGQVIVNNNGSIIGTSGILTSNSAYIFNTGTGYTTSISAILSGTAHLLKNGTGLVTLSGVNTYSGITTINAGTISIGADSGLGTAPVSAAAGQLTFIGGTLQTTNTFALSSNRGISLVGAGTINTAAGTMLTYGGIMADGGSFTKLGVGTLTLSGSNNYTGSTIINGGTIRASNNSALGTVSGGVTVANGAALELDKNVTIGAEQLSLSGTGMSNGGALCSVSGNNIYQGSITLAGDTFINADALTTTLSLDNSINGNFSLSLNGSGTINLGGVVGGSVPLASFTTGNALLLNINSGAVKTIGAQTYNGRTAFNYVGTTTLTTSNNNITATATVDAGKLTAVRGSTLTLNTGSGNVTFTNVNNDFATVSVTKAGAVSLVDSNELTISGINTTGAIDIATLTNDLTVDGNIATSNSSSTAIALNAAKNTKAGIATGGDIFLKSGMISVGSGGIATLYTGSIPGSTALASLIGSGSGRFRYNSDEVSTNYTKALDQGMNEIYRETPTGVTVIANDETITYGSNPKLEYSFTGLQNNDTMSGIASVDVNGSKSSSGNYFFGAHTLTPSGLPASPSLLGYTYTYVTGTLTVQQKELIVTAPNNVTKIYNSLLDVPVAYSATLGTLAMGDVVNTAATLLYVDKNVGTNKTVNVSGLTLKDGSGSNITGNYNITYTPSITGSITQASLIVAAPDNVTKIYNGLLDVPVSYNAIVGSLVTGDVVNTAATLLYVDKNVGTNKTVNVSGLTLKDGSGSNITGNYNITYTPSITGSITQASLIVAARNAVKLYDGLSYSGGNGIIYMGIVNNESDLALHDTLVYTGTSQGAIQRGTYVITPGGYTSSNYHITYTDGQLTITSGLTPPEWFISPPPSSPPATLVEVNVGGKTHGNERGLPDLTSMEALSGNAPQVTRVFMPEEFVRSSSSFIFPLPENVLSQLSGSIGSENVFLIDGSPLPGWIKYDIQNKVFRATDVPPDAIPLTVLVKQGDLSWEVVILQ